MSGRRGAPLPYDARGATDGVLRVDDLRADAGPSLRGRMLPLLARERDVLIVRELVPRERLAALLDALSGEAGRRFPRSDFPAELRAGFLGRCVDLSSPDLREYFRDAERFREACAELGPLDVVRTLEALLAELARPLGLATPEGPDGARYAPASFRWLDPGGFIPPHIELEQTRRPAFADLARRAVPERMLSYYLVVRAPEAGGELVVSSFEWSELRPEMFVNGRTALGGLVDARPRQAFALDAGDVIVFDAGHHAHWVAPVRGRHARWTVGGFLMRAAGAEQVLAFS